MNQVTGFFQETKKKPTLKIEDPIAPDGVHTVPLVAYLNGEETNLGGAVVQIENGRIDSVTMTLSEKTAQALGLYVAMETLTMPLQDDKARVVVQNRMSIQKES